VQRQNRAADHDRVTIGQRDRDLPFRNGLTSVQGITQPLFQRALGPWHQGAGSLPEHMAGAGPEQHFPHRVDVLDAQVAVEQQYRGDQMIQYLLLDRFGSRVIGNHGHYRTWVMLVLP